MALAVIAFLVCIAGFVFALVKHIHRNDGKLDYEKTDGVNDSWLLLAILFILCAGFYAYIIGRVLAIF